MNNEPLNVGDLCILLINAVGTVSQKVRIAAGTQVEITGISTLGREAVLHNRITDRPGALIYLFKTQGNLNGGAERPYLLKINPPADFLSDEVKRIKKERLTA